MNKTLAPTVRLAAFVMAAAATLAAHSQPKPETVMLTLLPRAGADADLAKTLAEHWTAVRKLDLVNPARHLTLRARDDAGQPYFVEIFTWRDAAIPDEAPREIVAIWDRLNALTAPRGGRPGLAITPVTVVAP